MGLIKGEDCVDEEDCCSTAANTPQEEPSKSKDHRDESVQRDPERQILETPDEDDEDEGYILCGWFHKSKHKHSRRHTLKSFSIQRIAKLIRKKTRALKVFKRSKIRTPVPIEQALGPAGPQSDHRRLQPQAFTDSSSFIPSKRCHSMKIKVSVEPRYPRHVVFRALDDVPEENIASFFRLLNVAREGGLGSSHDASEQSTPTCTPPAHPHFDFTDSSLDSPQRSGESTALSRSRSLPSLSQTPSRKSKKYVQENRSQSSPDLMLQDSFERFTPDISADENRETYRFQCTSPGLYQCSVTGLVFNMEGDGDVTYRIVHWDWKLLAQNHKKPAGPLFDIKCQQQSVRQLHLPHCEIRSTGGCEFLSVAHVTGDVTEFIRPHKVTETHVVINITGFSGFGNVKDENSPPNPIRAVVLLFYTAPVHPDPTSFLHVLLLPGNIVLRDVLHKRKEINGDEVYIKTSPCCKLHPKQEYTLSTSPDDESILIQPETAEFDSEFDDNYFTTFEVVLEQVKKKINLLLTDSKNVSKRVWERRVYLSSSAISKSPVQNGHSLPSDQRLFSIRTGFIEGVSGPVLKSLTDRLFDKKVINDSEREAANDIQNRADKASFVIDTVRKKGEAASLEMISLFCDLDSSFSGTLGLI